MKLQTQISKPHMKQADLVYTLTLLDLIIRLTGCFNCQYFIYSLYEMFINVHFFFIHICTTGKSISHSAQGRPCGSRGGNDAIYPNTNVLRTQW